MTTNDPADPTKAPQPSATQDPGAKQIKAVWDPIPFPSPVQHVPLPKSTDTVPDPKLQLPKETNFVPIIKPPVSHSQPTDGDPGTKGDDGSQQGSGSKDPSGQSNTQNVNSAKIGSSEAPEVPVSPKQGASQDPSAPTQTQDTVSAQFAIHSAVQNNPQNDADPGDLSNPQGTTFADKTTTLEGHALLIGPSGVVQVDGAKVRPDQILTGISGVAAVNGGNSLVVASQILYSVTPEDTTSADKTTTLGGHALVVGPSGVIQFDGVRVRPGQILTGISEGAAAAVNEGNSIVVASQVFYPATPTAYATTVSGGQTTDSGNSISSFGGLIVGGFGNGGASISSSSLVGSVPTSIRNSTSSGLQTFEGKAETLGRMMLGKLVGLAIAIHLPLYLHIYS